MTRDEAFDEINKTQDYYVEELINKINDPDYISIKTINFTSPTGTGKTKMMSKIINKFPNYYFIVTTLSKGQLHLQIRDNLKQDCNQDNFYVYGSADYKINSKLDAEDIIGRIPTNTKCIWLRDEGHIKTSRFDALLLKVCYKVINFSATNMHSDIQCNFTQTMMLRTVEQTNGTPEDAIKKLLEIKQIHKNVPAYNPCAIFRCVGGDNKLYNQIVKLCKEKKLKYIDITENTYSMTELCEDDNEYDVIINKFKIVEGIDIRRAHVLYMDNQPSNNATTIQVIGRCRRNALLYRNDIDILAPENKDLLVATRKCYVYYNVKNMKIDSDTEGELYYAFCDKISCESLKSGTIIHVENGQLSNGLYVLELMGCTGDYSIEIDEQTGFNMVSPLTAFYKSFEIKTNDYIYIKMGPSLYKDIPKYIKIHISNVPNLISYFDNYFDMYNNGLYPEFYRLCIPHYIYNGDFYEDHFIEVDEVYSKYKESEKTISKLLEPVTKAEEYYLDIGILHTTKYISKSSPSNQYFSYQKIVNDKESAIVGVDIMHPIKIKNTMIWTEASAITSKIGGYNKLNSFLSSKYAVELVNAKEQCFTGKNNFKLDKKCNSALGYCVEYYSKYIVYGDSYLEEYIDEALYEAEYRSESDQSRMNYTNETIIVRACMLKYKAMMVRSFGGNMSKIIRGISVSTLLQTNYEYFVNLVVTLGTQTAKYVLKTLYSDRDALDNVDPDLSVRHIRGLADYITTDTILDVKVRNNIDEKCVKQVLAYHYLSTKRSDLHIKRVIVYDAVSDKSVIVNITDKNLVKG